MIDISDQVKLKEIELILSSIEHPVSAREAETLSSLALSIKDRGERDSLLKRIAILLAKQQYGQFQELLHHIEGVCEKVEGLIEIANSQIALKQYAEAMTLLKEAEASVSQAGELWQQAEMLTHIAQSIFSVGERSESLRILEKAVLIAQLGEQSTDCQESVDSSSVLWEISQILSQIGEDNRAYDIAVSIKSPGKREKAIQSLRS